VPETITGIAVKSIERSVVTEDGAHMLLTYVGLDGKEATLAIPSEQLQGLLMLVSQSLNAADRNRGAPPEQKQAIEAVSWVLNEAPDKRLVISIRVPGGGQMSFVLPAKGDQQVYGVEELLKRSAAARTDATKH
jgi:hypothetical protein